MKNILALLFTFVAPVLAMAQGVESPEMADMLYESGKIYVVVAVITIIFTGIIIYLISIDKKLGKLEKEIDNA